jgi:hypothetical protein
MMVEKLKDYGRSFYSLLGERRKAERVDFNGTVSVSCKDRYGQLTTHVCTCLNLSTKGLGLVSPEAIPENSDIYVHSEDHNFKRFARVRYCLRRGERNYIGCYFQASPAYWN